MNLTPKQLSMLRFVAENPGCSMERLMVELWPHSNSRGTNLRALVRSIEKRSGVVQLFDTAGGWWWLTNNGRRVLKACDKSS